MLSILLPRTGAGARPGLWQFLLVFLVLTALHNRAQAQGFPKLIGKFAAIAGDSLIGDSGMYVRGGMATKATKGQWLGADTAVGFSDSLYHAALRSVDSLYAWAADSCLTPLSISPGDTVYPGRYVLTDSIINGRFVLYGDSNSRFIFYTTASLRFDTSAKAMQGPGSLRLTNIFWITEKDLTAFTANPLIGGFVAQNASFAAGNGTAAKLFTRGKTTMGFGPATSLFFSSSLSSGPLIPFNWSGNCADLGKAIRSNGQVYASCTLTTGTCNVTGQNLVGNADFETHIPCPGAVWQGEGQNEDNHFQTTCWYNAVGPDGEDGCYSPGTIDYINVHPGGDGCSSVGFRDWTAHTGDGALNMLIFQTGLPLDPGTSWTEYAQQSLPQALLPNRAYFVQAFARYSDRAPLSLSCSQIGLLFSDQPSFYSGIQTIVQNAATPAIRKPMHIVETPQLVIDNLSGSYASKWGVFTTTERSSKLTIGRFLNPASPAFDNYIGNLPSSGIGYLNILIDDITLWLLPYAGPDRTLACNEPEGVELGVDGCYGSDITVDYEWLPANGLPSGSTDLHPVVHPTATTTYTLIISVTNNMSGANPAVAQTCTTTCTVTVQSLEIWVRTTPTDCGNNGQEFNISLRDNPLEGLATPILLEGRWIGVPINDPGAPGLNYHEGNTLPNVFLTEQEGYVYYERLYEGGCRLKAKALILGQNLIYQDDDLRTDLTYEDLDIYVLDDVNFKGITNTFSGSTVTYVVGEGAPYNDCMSGPGGSVKKSLITMEQDMVMEDNATFLPVCNQMWKGIAFNNKSHINTTGCDGLHYCYIVGAEKGLFLSEVFGLDNGAELLISNVKFKNCLRGIEVVAQSVDWSNEDVLISNCYFESDPGGMPEPFGSDMGSQFVLNDCDVEPPKYVTEIAIYGEEWLKGSNPARIEYCTFSGFRLGVGLNNSSGFELRSNMLYLGGYGFTSVGGFFFQSCEDILTEQDNSGYKNVFRFVNDMSNYPYEYQADQLYDHGFMGAMEAVSDPSAIAAVDCNDLELGGNHFNSWYYTSPAGGRGITLLDSRHAHIHDSYFERQDYGINLLGDLNPHNDELTLIEANTIDNCETGLRINASDHSTQILDMHCNEFIAFESESHHRKGILIEQLIGDAEIGNDHSVTIGGNIFYPNLGGNLFPPKGYFGLPYDDDPTDLVHWPLRNDVLAGYSYWSDPGFFDAFYNTSGYKLTYHRYVNEYTSKKAAAATSVFDFPFPDRDYLAYTANNGTNTPSAHVPAFTGPASPLCDFVSSDVVFPTTKTQGGKKEARLSDDMPSTLSLAPNPAENNFVISAMGHDAGMMNVSLLDVSGTRARVFTNVNAGQRLDLKGLPDGIYTVHIQGQGFSQTRKLSILRSR